MGVPGLRGRPCGAERGPRNGGKGREQVTSLRREQAPAGGSARRKSLFAPLSATFLRSCTNSRSIQIRESELPVARRKIAGILCVFQDFSTRPAAILAVKLGAEAIGTASEHERHPSWVSFTRSSFPSSEPKRLFRQSQPPGPFSPPAFPGPGPAPAAGGFPRSLPRTPPPGRARGRTAPSPPPPAGRPRPRWAGRASP